MKNLVIYRELPEALLALLRQRYTVTYFDRVHPGNAAQFAASVREAHRYSARA